MNDLTLEALAKRVETLEKQVAEPTRPVSRTGDWDSVEKAMRELEDYDFDAWRKQRNYDLAHAEGTAS